MLSGGMGILGCARTSRKAGAVGAFEDEGVRNGVGNLKNGSGGVYAVMHVF